MFETRKTRKIRVIGKFTERMVFYRELLLHPFQVASPMPSAPSTVRDIAERIKGDTRKVVVEYGPGDGVITKGFLQKGVLTDDSVVILIEANKGLAKLLKKKIRDPRVAIFHDTAANVLNILARCDEEYSDITLSGLPHSQMSEEEAEAITEATALSLRKPDGEYYVYNKSHAIATFLPDHFSHIETFPLHNDGKPRLTLFKADFSD